jgi:hypothetical protein
MERQDRMNQEIFNKLNDLGYRVGDLEEDRPAAGDPPRPVGKGRSMHLMNLWRLPAGAGAWSR